MHRVAHGPRAVVELAGARLGVGNQVGHGLVGAVDRHADEEEGAEQRQDDFEVLVDAVGQLLEQMGIGRQVDVVQLDDVRAVGGAALEGLDGDETVAAGAVFHDDGLVPQARQLVGHQARSAVRPAAHGERIDDAHLLGGPVGGGTRLGTRGRQRAQGQGAKGEARLAAIDAEGAVFHCLSPSRCWACWVAWPYAGNARAALVFRSFAGAAGRSSRRIVSVRRKAPSHGRR